MTSPDGDISALALLCNRQGIVLRVLIDEVGISGLVTPGQPWSNLVDDANQFQARNFWQVLNSQQAVFGWELNVPLAQGLLPLQFSAGLMGEVALLVAANTMAPEQTIIDDHLPPATAEAPAMATGAPARPFESPPPPAGEPELYEELARLNNELARKNQELEEKQNLLEKIFTLTPNASYLLDLTQDSYVLSNPSLPLLLGLEKEQLQRMGSDLLTALLHPQDRSAFQEYLQHRESARDREVLDHEFRVQRKDGKTIWLHSREWVFERDAEGHATHILGAVYDVTEMHQTQEDLLETAYRDELTGLYNRAFLESELKRLEKSATYPVSFLMADVRGLQDVNELEGQETGDELIRQAGKVLRAALRGEDIVARVGSDEFAAVLPYTPLMITQKVVERIQYNLAIHNAQHPQSPPLRMAIGIATANTSDGLANALQQAMERMYHDKFRRR
jgi:diguanylate cyclase (GGDEF)-like protein/PAS domain S-box-containing protein